MSFETNAKVIIALFIGNILASTALIYVITKNYNEQKCISNTKFTIPVKTPVGMSSFEVNIGDVINYGGNSYQVKPNGIIDIIKK